MLSTRQYCTASLPPPPPHTFPLGTLALSLFLRHHGPMQGPVCWVHRQHV